MKRKDYLIVALTPLILLTIPFIGNFTVEGCNWSGSDFLIMGLLIAVTTFIWRLLVTRPSANLAYRLGAGLGVGTGFLLVWVSLAVAVIGDDNPANALYLGSILAGLIGTGIARFQPRGMARAAFAAATVTFFVPIIAWFVDANDFSPGVAPVFLLNSVFVLMFAGAGLLFSHAAKPAK
ncbi:MAG: hypothetical protein R3F03_01320 [Opitutaceae bacterium]